MIRVRHGRDWDGNLAWRFKVAVLVLDARVGGDA